MNIIISFICKTIVTLALIGASVFFAFNNQVAWAIVFLAVSMAVYMEIFG